MAVQKIIIALFALTATTLLAAPRAWGQYYDEVPLKEPVYFTWLAEEGVNLSGFDSPASKQTCSVVAKLSEASNDNAPKSKGAPPLSRWEACGKLLDAAGDNEVVYKVLHDNKLHRELAAAVRDLRPVIVAQIAKQTDAANTPHNRRERLRLLGWIDGLMRLYPKAYGEKAYRLEWEGAPRIWAGYGSVTLGQEANLYAVNYGAYEDYSKLLVEHKGLEYGVPEWAVDSLEDAPYWIVGDVAETGKRDPYSLPLGILYGLDPNSGRIPIESLMADQEAFHVYLRLAEFYRPGFTYYLIRNLEKIGLQSKLTSLRELSSLLSLYGFEDDRLDCLRRIQSTPAVSATPIFAKWPSGEGIEIPGETVAFIDDIYRTEDESSVAAKGQEAAARILLDILLNEEAVLALIEDAGLRLDYQRAAVSLRIPISREFALALRSPDSQMHARAMLWADGLMRLTPLVEGQEVSAANWERSSRKYLMSSIQDREMNGPEFAKDYFVFLEVVGCKPAAWVTREDIMPLFDDPKDIEGAWWFYQPQAVAKASSSYWSAVMKDINPVDYTLPSYYAKPEPSFRDDSTELRKMIIRMELFRPWLALQMFSITECEMTSQVPPPMLINGILEAWGLWLEQQDAAAEPAAE